MAPPPPEDSYSSSSSASASASSAYTSSSDNAAESDTSSCVTAEVTSNAVAASQTLINQHQLEYEEEEEEEESKDQFNRLWSLTDEIVILQGLAEYQETKGWIKLDAATASDFHEYIENWLSVEVTASKLSSKIRKLKKKYQVASWEGVEFNKDHDKVVYELSNKLWGNEDGKGFEKRAGLRSAGGNGAMANAGSRS